MAAPRKLEEIHTVDQRVSQGAADVSAAASVAGNGDAKEAVAETAGGNGASAAAAAVVQKK